MNARCSPGVYVLVVCLLNLVGGCQLDLDRSRPATTDTGEVLSELATPLRFSRQLRSYSANATQSLYLMPVVGDSAAHGGLRLWLRCETTLDAEYLGSDPCAMESLILEADDEQFLLGTLAWRTERMPLPTENEAVVQAAHFAIDRSLLDRIRDARALRLHEPEALNGPFLLANDARKAWPHAASGEQLKFRARVGVPDRESQRDPDNAVSPD